MHRYKSDNNGQKMNQGCWTILDYNHGEFSTPRIVFEHKEYEENKHSLPHMRGTIKKEEGIPVCQNARGVSQMLISGESSGVPTEGRSSAAGQRNQHVAKEKEILRPQTMSTVLIGARNLFSDAPPLDPRLRKMGSWNSTLSSDTVPTVNSNQRTPTLSKVKQDDVKTPETNWCSSLDPRIRYRMNTNCYSGLVLESGMAVPIKRQQPYTNFANQGSSKSEIAATQSSDNVARSTSQVRDPRLANRMRLDAMRRNSNEFVIEPTINNQLNSSLKAQQSQQNSVNNTGMAQISTNINNVSGSPNDPRFHTRATSSAISEFKVTQLDSPLPKNVTNLGLQTGTSYFDVTLSSSGIRTSYDIIRDNSKKKVREVVSEKIQSSASSAHRSFNHEQGPPPKLRSYLSTPGIRIRKRNYHTRESHSGMKKPDEQHSNKTTGSGSVDDLGQDSTGVTRQTKLTSIKLSNAESNSNGATSAKNCSMDLTAFHKDFIDTAKSIEKGSSSGTSGNGFNEKEMKRVSEKSVKAPHCHKSIENIYRHKPEFRSSNLSTLKPFDANNQENEAGISKVLKISVAKGERSSPPSRRPPTTTNDDIMALKKTVWTDKRAELLISFEKRVECLPQIFTRQLGYTILNLEFAESLRQFGDNSIFEEQGLKENDICDAVINLEQDPFVPKECLVPERRIVVAKYLKTLVQIDKLLDMQEYGKCIVTLNFIRCRLSRLIQWFFIVEHSPRTEIDHTTEEANNFWNELIRLASYKCVETKEIDQDWKRELEQTAELTVNRIQKMPFPTCNSSVLGTVEDHHEIGPETFQSDLDKIIRKVNAQMVKVKKD